MLSSGIRFVLAKAFA